MLLLDAPELEHRRAAARTGLASLADSLAADLGKVMSRPVMIPPEKAKLTRVGGRCKADGTMLAFDPFEPHEHECPRCHTRYREDEHYRWWIMSYQLWLAERAVHAATLHALLGDPSHRARAEEILARYAESYASYPNSDNVLGPSRLFFSTYLESIWLLEICVATDLLEIANGTNALTDNVRAAIIEPAAALIRSYDEGDSNRQVWNNAALLASARLMNDSSAIDAIVNGYHGVAGHLDRALLRDGTWYEGENYHQFAHRGLWYGVTLAERAGVSLSGESLARFQEGFATPFLSALPDLTFPARRDSPHRVSVRQWRYAESSELGLARGSDERLVGALSTLYGDDLPRGDTGRWRSAGESERNEPPVRLSRADLGWRSLLHARAELPALRSVSPGSVLLEGQGLAVFRRDRGQLYAALDYGHSGGGHGHPDRLNLLLVDGEHRWLDDSGTGSYVDPTLMWYRSSLAHNAPMISGHTQLRVSGTLLAHEDRAAAGWVRADAAGIASRSAASRALIVMPDYLVDIIEWQTGEDGWLDLPLHVDADLREASHWNAIEVAALRISDEGSSFVRSAERAEDVTSPIALVARDGDAQLDAWILPSRDIDVFRLVAPGPPGAGERRFILLRCRAPSGRLAIAWSPRGAVRRVEESQALSVHLADGSRHEHRREGDGWHTDLHAGGARSSLDLAGNRVHVRRPTPASAAPARLRQEASGPLQLGVASDRRPGGRWLLDASDRERRRFPVLEMGEANYRRTELEWASAGAPTATVILAAADGEIHIEIDVRKKDPVFAPPREWNPLDNERADINSDGVQLYLILPRARLAGSWLLVPETAPVVRVTDLAPSDAPIPYRAEWRSTPGGYAIRFFATVGVALEPGTELLLEVMVNEISRDRERRRGQLVLSGGTGEFIYLQGDRPRGSWVTLRLVHD